MSVLITGGSGFLGAHLARRMVESRRNVVLYDRTFDGLYNRKLTAHIRPGGEEGKSQEEVWNELATLVPGDVTDSDLLAQTVHDHRVDVIVHLATLLTEQCAQEPVRASQINCVGAASVFEVALRSPVRRVVFGSSVAVFGQDKGLSRGDDSPLTPPNVYGATKAFVEHMAAALMADHPQLDLLGLRFGWVYGSGRVRGWNEIQRVIEGFALEQEKVLYPDYDSPNDWTYVEDAIEAIQCCMESPRSSTVAYNVSGDYRRIQEAVAHLKRRFPKVLAMPYPAVLPQVAWDFASDRIATETGYIPKVSLEEGLDKAVAELRRMHGLPE